MVSNFGGKITFLILALAMAAGVWVQTSGRDKNLSASPEQTGATWVKASEPLPPFALLTGDGKTFDNASLAGRWTVLFFGFASCPDVCPTTLATLAGVQQQLVEAGLEPLQVAFISVDPERDTPALATKYAQSFDPNFLAATAPIDALRALTDPLGILFVRVPQGGSYTMDHSSALTLIGPDGALAAVIGGPHTRESLYRDLADALR